MTTNVAEIRPSALSPQDITTRLERKTQDMVTKIEQSEFWKLLAHPSTSSQLVASIIKYALLETFSYGPLVVEATFRAIGRVPNGRLDLMRPMVSHLMSEVDHGELALSDFVKLGGDEVWARSRQITPASLAMGGLCYRLAERESPYAYLGYMYLFESVTPIVTQRLQELLATKGFPVSAQNFVDLHATEDVKHTDILTKLVQQIVVDYPETAPAIEYAADCFATVWPLPVWEASLAHALAEMSA